MEVTSRFIEDNDLGSLHVVRFEPEHALANERGVFFNSFNGRVTTIDGFALPYEIAKLKGIAIDFIERPGTGASSLPENDALRKDYKKYGFIAVRDALLDAQGSEPDFLAIEKIHGGGFSLGGHASSLYLDTIGELAASATYTDPAGLCNVNRAIGSMRFFSYAGIEMLANALKLKPKVDALFEGETEIVQAHQLFLETSGLPEPPILSKEEKKLELSEVTWPTKGKALVALKNVLTKAAANERKFELRAQISPMRFVTDNRSIAETNEVLDDFDAEFPDQGTVTYGFMQKNGMHWWHDLSVDPAVIRTLVTTPLSQLRKRLRYFG